MYLEQIELERFNGSKSSLRLEDIPSGIVVVYGPNGSGKSTIGRAIKTFLFNSPIQRALRGSVTFQSKYGVYTGDMYQSVVSWSNESPVKQPQELEDTCIITLRDLFRTVGKTASAIEKEIQNELNGGFDLEQLITAKKYNWTHKKDNKNHTIQQPKN